MHHDAGAVSRFTARPLRRWLTASTLSVIVAAGSWALCALRFNLDTETAATVAALCTALVGAPLAAWATTDNKSRFVAETQPGTSPTGQQRRVRLGALPPVADARQSREASTALIEASVPGSVVVLTGLGGVGKTQLATGTPTKC